jgi:Acetyltransferase (GNAT) domain
MKSGRNPELIIPQQLPIRLAVENWVTFMLTAAPEININHDETASLAMEAFASPHVVFDPEHLRWFYNDAFSMGAQVIALHHDDHKVGQIAMVRQKLRINGVDHIAGQLCDLFILKQYRSKRNIAMLYNEVEKHFIAEGVRFGLGMPNEKAIRVNEHYFKLMPFLKMEIRLGMAQTAILRKPKLTTPFDPYPRDKILKLLEPFETASIENGLPWDAQSLYKRLLGRKFRYAIHTNDAGLLISSPRVSRSVGYTCLAGFFPRTGQKLSAKDARRLTTDACAYWRQPLFAFAGMNTSVEKIPGIRLPTRARPSPMLLQMRDFAPSSQPIHLDRFQLLDFDFA